MKKIFTLSILALSMFQNANATVRTVSNNVNSPGQYTNLQTACDAASANDTIYVHASENNYGDLTLRKPLVIIGEGMLPNEQVLLNVSITSITLSCQSAPSLVTSAGSKFYGIKVTGQTVIQTDNNSVLLGNFTFERCDLQSLFIGSGTNSASSNNVINQCKIYSLVSNYAGFSNTVISNSLMYSLGLNTLYGSNNIMRNCLYGGTNMSVKGFVISNNIFYSPTNAFTQSNVNSTFTNNLFSYSATPTLTNGTTTASGNVFGDPMFTTPELVNTVINYNYSTANPIGDFTLLAGSPAMTLGTDGTQAGLYGGTTPWIDGTGGGVFRYHTMPKQVPFVIDMNILNNTIPVNGTLNVQINARTQD